MLQSYSTSQDQDAAYYIYIRIDNSDLKRKEPVFWLESSVRFAIPLSSHSCFVPAFNKGPFSHRPISTSIFENNAAFHVRYPISGDLRLI